MVFRTIILFLLAISAFGQDMNPAGMYLMNLSSGTSLNPGLRGRCP